MALGAEEERHHNEEARVWPAVDCGKLTFTANVREHVGKSWLEDQKTDVL